MGTASTGTKDWYAVFTRGDSKLIIRLGPYVTRRAAMEDAKVVLRAKIAGLRDEDGNPVTVQRILNRSKVEVGYEASDGSVAVHAVAEGGQTWGEREWATKDALKKASEAGAKAAAAVLAEASPKRKARAPKAAKANPFRRRSR